MRRVAALPSQIVSGTGVSIYLICNIHQATRVLAPTTESSAKASLLNDIIVICIPYSCRPLGRGFRLDTRTRRTWTNIRSDSDRPVSAKSH